jgi:hypothetical protein
MASRLHELEEERRKLLLHEQNLITAHNEHLVKLHSHLAGLDKQILRLRHSQETCDDQPPAPARVKSSKKVKVKESSSASDAWQCLCGNMLAGDRRRCGKCRRWKGGKRETRWGQSAASTDSNPPIQRVVSNNDDDDEEEPTKRRRGRKTSGDSASSVSRDDEHAAASLLSLSLSLTF